MKPLIIGMGPARSHPTEAWHPAALSTQNLCHLILGDSSKRPVLDDHFEVINLNQNWHREEGSAWDSILPSEAEKTLRGLLAAKKLRGGRKAFLLGEQVTNFVFGFLRRRDCALALEGWRRLPKCVGHRLCIEDEDASVGKSLGYYDFVAIPVWHPRTVTTLEVKMPPGWQKKMAIALRSAGRVKSVKFKKTHQRRIPIDL